MALDRPDNDLFPTTRPARVAEAIREWVVAHRLA
jgi:hypothetical protein